MKHYIKKTLTFRRLLGDEIIPPSAMHSIDEGKTLMPVMSESTVGDVPNSFNRDRSFWIPYDAQDESA